MKSVRRLSSTRELFWLGLALAVGASTACSRGLDLVSPEEARAKLALDDREAKAFLEGARIADRKEDPLQRCLAFPNLPRNSWPAGLAAAHCALSFGSGINAKRMAEFLAAGKLDELDAIYSADQANHFSKSGFSEAIHGDFYFFDGSSESDRLSKLWLEKASQSPYAMMARGNHLLNAARRVRAARAESRMADAEIAQMRQLGKESAAIFAAAAAKSPNMIEAYNGLAHVGTIASLADVEAEGIEGGAKVDPLCAVLAMQEMWALTPRWGGSWPAMRARADELSRSLDERPLLSLAVVMPTVDEASQLGYPPFEPNWRATMGDMLRPLTLATTSPDVSDYLGIASCCEADRPKLESTLHFVAAGRFRRGTAYFALQRAIAIRENTYHPEWAIPDLQYVLDLEPANGPAHVNLGAVYYSQRRYQDAEKELLLGLEVPDSRGQSLFMLAQTLAMAGRMDEAHARAEQYHQEFPQNEESWTWIQDFFAKRKGG